MFKVAIFTSLLFCIQRSLPFGSPACFTRSFSLIRLSQPSSPHHITLQPSARFCSFLLFHSVASLFQYFVLWLFFLKFLTWSLVLVFFLIMSEILMRFWQIYYIQHMNHTKKEARYIYNLKHVLYTHESKL